MANMGGMPKYAENLLFQGVDKGDVGNALGFVHDYHKIELLTLSLGVSLNAMKRDFASD
jgi:hypothetical protein